MTMSNDDDVQLPSGLSRRDVLRGLGLLGAAAVVTPSALPACGSSSKSGTPITAGGETSSSGATSYEGAAKSGGAATTAGGGGDVGSKLATLLKIDSSGKNGKGVSWQMGDLLALTG